MKNSLKMLPVLWSLTGCAGALPAIPALSGLSSPPVGMPILTTTKVNLYKQNFKIVRANVVGSSVGFSLLGLFTFVSPGYEEAMTRLYHSAGITEGKAQALVNVVHENTSDFFLLFALPKVTVRADVIEFTDTPAVKAKGTESMF